MVVLAVDLHTHREVFICCMYVYKTVLEQRLTADTDPGGKRSHKHDGVNHQRRFFPLRVYLFNLFFYVCLYLIFL